MTIHSYENTEIRVSAPLCCPQSNYDKICVRYDTWILTSEVFFVFSDKGEVRLLTKGDNNAVDDRGLYNPGQDWVRRSEVVGRARG